MTTMVERVNENFVAIKKWREEQIRELYDSLAARMDIAKAIDKIFGDDIPRTYVNLTSFEVSFNSVAESRAFISELFNKLGSELEDFTKEMEVFSSKLQYYYISQYKKISIKVSPSDPVEGCTPVLKKSTSSYWVCMNK